VLLHLVESGMPLTQQPGGLGPALEQIATSYRTARELLRAGEKSPAGPETWTATLAGLGGRRLRLDPGVIPGASDGSLNSIVLMVKPGFRRCEACQEASHGGRADAAGEFGNCGRMQGREALPSSPVDQIVVEKIRIWLLTGQPGGPAATEKDAMAIGMPQVHARAAVAVFLLDKGMDEFAIALMRAATGPGRILRSWAGRFPENPLPCPFKNPTTLKLDVTFCLVFPGHSGMAFRARRPANPEVI